MRVLVSSTAGTGHFGPVVPFAHALRAAGHEVAVAAPASFAETVARTGLPHRPFDDPPADRMGALFARLPDLPPGEADRTVVREVFGRLDAQAGLPGVRATIDDWRPDLVLREPAEVASLAAAEAAGIPHATVSIGMTSMRAFFAGLMAEPFADLDDLAGLPPGRCAAANDAAPVLTSVPAVLDEARGATEGDVQRFRTEEPAAGDLPPAWGDPEAPLVYLTFGSVAAVLAPFRGVYAAALAAFAGTPYRVLLTTGVPLDRLELGTVPDNVRVEPWWPQAAAMPHAAVVVGHGGFGTTMTAVTGGVPQVVLPLFTFDQQLNADHVAAAGAGVQVEGGPAGIARLPEAVAAVLADAGLADAAQDLAAAVAALPPVTDAVAVLEELSRRGA